MSDGPRRHADRGRLVHAAVHEVATHHGAFEVHVFRDLAAGRPVLAITRGDVRGMAPLLVRVHSACVTSEVLGACDCDCAEQLDAALERIAAQGRGVVFYLMQEGRGAGLSAKARDRMLVQTSGGRLDTFSAYAALGLPHDLRRYDAVADACRGLGADAPIRLLTNNPEKARALAGLGLTIDGTAALAPSASGYNGDYLDAKREAGHRFELDGWRPGASVAPPAPLEREAPRRVRGTTDLLRMGAYWLPVSRSHVGRASPSWLRLTAYVDVARGREHFSVSIDRANGTHVAVPFASVQRSPLLERLPLLRRAGQRAWRAALEALVHREAGCVVFPGGVDAHVIAADDASDDRAAAAILRDQLGDVTVEPLVAEVTGVRWLRVLAEQGTRLKPARVLAHGDAEAWTDVGRAG